jgi:hypothetical protein
VDGFQPPHHLIFDTTKTLTPVTDFVSKKAWRHLTAVRPAKGMGLMGDPKRSIRFGQELGSQEYNNAFNRYVTGFNANTGERNQLYNRYAGVAGTGQQAVGGVTAQGANMAGNIGNAYMTSAANTGNAALAAAGQRHFSVWRGG